MPRKPKTSAENKPASAASTQSANGNATAAEPKKKSRAAAEPKKKKPTAVKQPATKRTTARSSKPAFEPTDDQIRLRAYFLAEHRHKLSLPGDSNHDWIEARRQLIEESRRSAS